MFLSKSSSALCFDDILLVPQDSSVASRNTVDLSMSLSTDERKIILSLPVIAAPMDTVCSVEMCMAMSNAGGLGILHRYKPLEEQILDADALASFGIGFGVSVGATGDFIGDAIALVDVGAELVLVDIANGHSQYAVRAVQDLRRELGDEIHIMAGNVSTVEGFRNLAMAGADSIRVGIGGGSACTTRIVSGHGIPTLQSIMDIYEWKKNNTYCSIIADGGIRNSGDMVKAFAAGADSVMVGSMLAGTDESPGEITSDANGREVKLFRGMASAHAQMDKTGKVSVSEGVSTTVPYKGPVEHILKQIRGGLGSGCSYSGVDSLSELSESAEYRLVTSLSVNESRPHAIHV